MSATNKEQGNGKLSAKDARKNIEQQLSTLLSGWKDQLGEKKFRNRIKKAAKLLSKGLPVNKKTADVKVKKSKAAKGLTAAKEVTA
ncbi:hypothetical protein [uncultured Chitinophaga sp.]|jgi:hypothetical protein|uniref:hypothetical protein n=1 Tax=uncultured Chitinophaga sp. TaxID=339340 RepID=UPI0026283308|nr:hypothetical protein [uncultured Chitinophaga sp.]